MDINKILSLCDHTALSPTATLSDIFALCDEGMLYKTASVCIPPTFVRAAREYVRDALRICTVIGFPLGYMSTEAKLEECRVAIADGTDEIDMVINIARLKSGDFDYVEEEISKIREATRGYILKVIIEACLLTDEEKIKMCEIISRTGADYIKTSTGFSSGGATPEDIVLFSEHISAGVKIKAAGGISSLADAEELISLGASRLGTSRIVGLVKAEDSSGY